MTSSKSRDVPSINTSPPLILRITLPKITETAYTLVVIPEPGLSACSSMDQLASKFIAFFQDKVRLIQENLTLKADPNYEPEDNPDAVDDKLNLFVPLTDGY